MLRVAEAADVGAAVVAGEVGGPRGEGVVDELEDALVPRVAEEEPDHQPAARGLACTA